MLIIHSGTYSTAIFHRATVTPLVRLKPTEYCDLGTIRPLLPSAHLYTHVFEYQYRLSNAAFFAMTVLAPGSCIGSLQSLLAQNYPDNHHMEKNEFPLQFF